MVVCGGIALYLLQSNTMTLSNSQVLEGRRVQINQIRWSSRCSPLALAHPPFHGLWYENDHDEGDKRTETRLALVYPISLFLPHTNNVIHIHHPEYAPLIKDLTNYSFLLYHRSRYLYPLLQHNSLMLSAPIIILSIIYSPSLPVECLLWK